MTLYFVRTYLVGESVSQWVWFGSNLISLATQFHLNNSFFKRPKLEIATQYKYYVQTITLTQLIHSSGNYVAETSKRANAP